MKLNVLVKGFCILLVLLSSSSSFSASSTQQGASAPIVRKTKKIVQRYYGPKEKIRKPAPTLRPDSTKRKPASVA